MASASWKEDAVREGLAVARTLREELALRAVDPVPCVVELAERNLDLDVVVARLRPSISGFYLHEPAPTVLVNATEPPVRQRFTLAHEIGHCVMKHGSAARVLPAVGVATAETAGASGPDAAVDADAAATPNAAAAPRDLSAFYTPVASTDPNERAANTFAAELLAPEDGVRRVLRDWSGEAPFDQLIRLSAHFGISAFSAIYKLRVAEVIDHAGVHRLRRRLTAQEHLPHYAALGLTPLDDTLQRHHDAGGGARTSTRARARIARLRAELDAAL